MVFLTVAVRNTLGVFILASFDASHYCIIMLPLARWHCLHRVSPTPYIDRELVGSPSPLGYIRLVAHIRVWCLHSCIGRSVVRRGSCSTGLLLAFPYPPFSMGFLPLEWFPPQFVYLFNRSPCNSCYLSRFIGL